MFPIVLFAGIAALVAWAAKPNKKTGVSGTGLMGYATVEGPPPQKALPPIAQPPLKPEAERLLALLVLFARDKKFEAGRKRYLSPNTAIEAMRLAKALGMSETAMAIRKDGPIPTSEFLPGRTVSIRQSVVSYGTTGKA